jgi:arsenate reductase-like glutaredoxin family protein
MSCQKAQGFLEHGDWKVGDRTDAGKERRGREAALALARTADRVVVAKGKKVVAFDMTKEPPDDDTLAAHLLGPTGNLRAPTLRKGRTLLVGFSDEAYREVLGE